MSKVIIIFSNQRENKEKNIPSIQKYTIYQSITKSLLKIYNKNIAEIKQRCIFANAKSKI